MQPSCDHIHTTQQRLPCPGALLTMIACRGDRGRVHRRFEAMVSHEEHEALLGNCTHCNLTLANVAGLPLSWREPTADAPQRVPPA